MPILRRARAKGADADDVRSDLPQGTLDLLILKVLAPEPLHGYAIAQRLQQVSRDVVQVQQGTLYPALHRLEQRGYLQRRVEGVRHRARRQVLQADEAGPGAARSGYRQLGPPRRRRRPDPAPGRRPAMTWLGRLRRRAALDRDLDRELQDHLERRTQALVAAGLTPSQARRQARVESGGAEQVKEAVRDVRGTRWAHDLVQDARYGIRSLRKSPGLVVAALLSMGLGIGANTAIFSLVDALLLRSLPVERPGELVVVAGGSWTNPIWEAMRDRMAGRVAGALAWGEERLDLSNGGETDPVETLMVSGRFFETLGVRPALGRLLTADDDRRGGGPDGPTLVISERFWERRFQRDPGVVGRSLAVSGVPFTIVGVVPARFLGPTVGQTFDLAAPIATIDLVRPGGPQSALDGRADVVAQHHVPPTAGPVDRRPDGGAARRAAADPRGHAARLAGRGPRAALSRQPVPARAGVERPVRAAPALPRAAARPRRDRRPRAAGGLRQRRQPAAGAGRGAAPRAGGPAGPRRVARAAGPAAPDREPAARRARAPSPACCWPSGARASSSPRSARPTGR